MAEPKYWAQPSQPGFGARLGQALAGGLEGLKQGLAWKLAERQRKEKLEREKAQQDFVNSLKEAQEKREIWEHKEAIRKSEVAKEDREYLETVVRPYQEEQQKHNLWLNEQVKLGKLTPEEASANALRFARAADIRVQTKIRKLELKEKEIGLEELETPGRGGLGFETPQGQQTWQEPLTIKELPGTTAEAEIRKLVTEKRNPLTTDERKEWLDNKITRIAKEHKITAIQLQNLYQSIYIGREEKKEQ